ncbi:monosaccharide ABC transporter ATP-binding protein (CUT2 family) [Hoeflea marina]|uniref:Monosaccharide ABC transporter ATP-binding protein (CUT2 family) n=1 Tax=Hoeflea marina TaxID=274592 RepID=A0A317PMG7_9HYPH|nr:ATP-binding cassette domain-containing protein [Hoeflea marina]PWW01957.1 monosaccharide ABC transporter ATP-binding protein (CUT2 family) [Hoeflea marina]
MAVLELEDISKQYGAITALTNISLTLEAGQVVGLVGDNGAGKTTLVKIIAGNFHPTSGHIRLNGEPVSLHGPKDARSKGIEIVYQDLALADNLTAAANIFLGRELTLTARTPEEAERPWYRRRRWWLPVPEILDYRGMYKRAGELFMELKSETRPRDLVRRMSGGQRQAVAIARTRLSNPRIVLMDEPTAAISVRQVAEVLSLIRRLRDQGIAIILISHRIPDVFAVCDRLVVLRRGEKVADKNVADSSPEEVTGLITGAIERA